MLAFPLRGFLDFVGATLERLKNGLSLVSATETTT